jgi:hypothetical protein
MATNHGSGTNDHGFCVDNDGKWFMLKNYLALIHGFGGLSR